MGQYGDDFMYSLETYDITLSSDGKYVQYMVYSTVNHTHGDEYSNSLFRVYYDYSKYRVTFQLKADAYVNDVLRSAGYVFSRGYNENTRFRICGPV